MTSDPAWLEQVQTRLRTDRTDAVRTLHELTARVSDIVDAARDSNLDDEHDPEGMTIGAEREMASSMVTRTRDRVRQIDAALARLADGSYGRCGRCGEPVPQARLQARPTAELCVPCAAEVSGSPGRR